jgi:hypothetical protein
MVDEAQKAMEEAEALKKVRSLVSYIVVKNAKLRILMRCMGSLLPFTSESVV